MRQPPGSSQRGALQRRHNERDRVWNLQPHDCLLNCLFRSRSKKTFMVRVTGLCEGNSPVTGEFPAQSASNAERVSIWWRHHGMVSQSFTLLINYAAKPNGSPVIIFLKFYFHVLRLLMFTSNVSRYLESLLLTLFNFNPSIDELSHARKTLE